MTKLEQSKGKESDEEAEKILFMEMCEICLWGNATDLSLLTNLTYEDIQKLQGSEARKAAEKNILVNDLPVAYDVLKKAQAEDKKERRVDIVLDNAGFELFVDLILAGYLLSSGLATLVVLHPKSIPWFVSDVLPSDFGALLNALASPKHFYETPSEDEQLQNKTPEPLPEKEADELTFLFQQWSQLYANGQVILRPNRYWTQPGSYWRLPHVEKELLSDLQTSELVIFKGDLNYRKLTGDVSNHHLDNRVELRANLPGTMGPRDSFCRGDWTAWSRLESECPRSTYMQGRCCRWTSAWRRREDPANRGRWWRFRGEEMGLEWEMGGSFVLLGEMITVQSSCKPFRNKNLAYNRLCN